MAAQYPPNIRKTSFFQDASNVNVTGSTFVGTVIETQHNTTVVDSSRLLHFLYNEVSHNAILNAGGRADEVRCYPGTREQVLAIIDMWRNKDTNDIFWLNGPAGAGKTAVIQTFAEQCITLNILMANFFFFRTDPSRNHIQSIVATIAFQIIQFYPEAKEYIETIISEKPFIFQQSIQEQFTHLIINPVNTYRNVHNDNRQIVLLIDGLDECGAEVKESKRTQSALLHILDSIASLPQSPFKILVASRKEPHLTMAFNKFRTPVFKLYLGDEYDPWKDIRQYVTAELTTIRRAHHLGHTLDIDWPSASRIEEIIKKSSGQFIYAATVMRFVSGSPMSPAHSLDQISGIRPVKLNTPFAELDAIYAHILSQVDDWEIVRNILLAELVGKKASMKTLDVIAPLNYTEADISFYISSLGSLMTYEYEFIEFHHASFVDFLTDETRSGDLFLDVSSFTTAITATHFSYIRDAENLCDALRVGKMVTTSTPLLEDTLAAFSPQHFEFEFRQQSEDDISAFLRMLDRVYSRSNTSLHKLLLEKWAPFFPTIDYWKQPLSVFETEITEINDVQWADDRKGGPQHSRTLVQNQVPIQLSLEPSLTHTPPQINVVEHDVAPPIGQSPQHLAIKHPASSELSSDTSISDRQPKSPGHMNTQSLDSNIATTSYNCQKNHYIHQLSSRRPKLTRRLFGNIFNRS